MSFIALNNTNGNDEHNYHLFRRKRGEIEAIVHQFKALKVQIVAPCHCTGNLAMEQFQQAFQNSCYKIGTGTILTLER